uniref:Zgc:194221 n=1 Tax=Sinocyclocheilus rhinocerous TaxID=307959 RepID=A0A673IN56_9TELE
REGTLAVTLLQDLFMKKSKKRRSVWVHPILQKRKNHGEFHQLIQELRLDNGRFKAYFRVDKDQFDYILRKVGPSISKWSFCHETISPAQQLCICFLRYCCIPDLRTIAFSYRVGHSTVAGIIKDVCEAIWDNLVEEYMPPPNRERWREIAADFQQMWNFPNCVGAVDGKHIVIQAPASSSSLYFNYKGSFSIILLVVVDARYRFQVVDVGAYGRSSDGGTLAVSAFGRALCQGSLGIPEDKSLPGAEHLGPMPHVFVADEAFPLRRHMMRPHPGQNIGREKRLYNYRLSRARRMVECSFGILATQWRLYRRVLGVTPEMAEKAIKATCILHNLLRVDQAEDHPQAPSSEPDSSARAMGDLHRMSSNNSSREAITIREKFTQYFSSTEGAVPWQENII